MGRNPLESAFRCVSNRIESVSMNQTIKKIERTEVILLEDNSFLDAGLLSHDFDSERDIEPVDVDRIKSSGSEGKRKVSFANLDVRLYNIVIGDHPCCTMGCPLSLGWDYSETPRLTVDHYEANRSPRRRRSELRTSCEERRQLLSEDGYSEGELRKASRRLHRERSCSAKLCERMNESFFNEQCKAAVDR